MNNLYGTKSLTVHSLYGRFYGTGYLPIGSVRIVSILF